MSESVTVPDPTPLMDDWFWRGVSTVGGAVIAAGATIFANRKTAEAAVMARVDQRIETAFKHQDQTIERQGAEIEDLRWTMAEEKAECDRKLTAMREEIARLMLKKGVAAYTGNDIAEGQNAVRGAQARQRGKKP